MNILAIETTGRYASAAVLKTDRQGSEAFLRQEICRDDYSHLERLCLITEKLLEGSGMKPEELDAVAVSRGPGSFTGIRIGMTTAKALALVWKKPVIEVPTLKSFAAGKAADEPGVIVCPLFDARREQVYAAAYSRTDGRIICRIEDSACSIDEYLRRLSAVMEENETAVFFGDGCEAFASRLAEFPRAARIAEEEQRFQKAEYIARLALTIDERKDAFTAMPEYLRMAEAERKLKEHAENSSN